MTYSLRQSYPMGSMHRQPTFRERLTQIAAKLRLLPLYRDPSHVCVYTADARNPVRSFGPHMSFLYCRCGQGKIFAR